MRVRRAQRARAERAAGVGPRVGVRRRRRGRGGLLAEGSEGRGRCALGVRGAALEGLELQRCGGVERGGGAVLCGHARLRLCPPVMVRVSAGGERRRLRVMAAWHSRCLNAHLDTAVGERDRSLDGAYDACRELCVLREGKRGMRRCCLLPATWQLQRSSIKIGIVGHGVRGKITK